MANNTAGNPWVLDTAASIKTTPVRILFMEWIPNAAANDLTIIDVSGNTIWDRDALAGGTPGIEAFVPPEMYTANGFNLSVIDGGTLYVYIK